jgi:hypothetical protein
MLKDEINFLFPSLGTNEEPQIVLATANKRVLAWLPGKEPVIESKRVQAINTHKLVGLTGKAYRNDAWNMLDECSLHFLAIDIDDYIDWNKISDILPRYCIRFSNSKTGLHLIKRIKRIEIAKNERINERVKEAMQEDIRALTLAGIPVCSYGYRAFFMAAHGWLKKIDEIDTIVLATKRDSYNRVGHNSAVSGIDATIIDDCEIKIKNLVEILLKKGIIEENNGEIDRLTSVYVRELYEALKGTEFEFESKSPMKNNSWHINSQLSIENDIAKLFTFAANCWQTIALSI